MSRYVDPRRTVSPESALASDIFDKFCSANTLKGILSQYRQLCCVLRIKPTHFPDFYPRLKAKLSSWRAQGLWSKFEKRASQKCYGRGKTCYGTRVLIIGAGPCGLRSAIEAQLLGAKVVLVEKRDRFSRNNVLHLWPFVIADLKGLGAKKFYGKFCAGSIDHISIRQLQCILLKVALLLGVEVHEGVGFEGLREPSDNEGWRAVISPADHPVSHYNFDVLIGADGRRNTLDGFKRKALRAKLAIAITANFINKHTEAEARVKEISGVSYIFNQKFFQDLCEATGIDLENIVYYKDETHYFVMTAKKQSLLNKGVLLQDFADTAKLLSHENINSDALMEYAWEAAMFATEYQLPDIEFAVNHYGQPDVAMFDFTAMYAAENACRVVQKKSHKLLMTLVGDSLLEPFWPTGSGCARGFLSSFDACWMLRSWSSGVKSVLEVIAERESIYRLLGQTTPENLQKEHVAYTIDPHTRYPNLNLRLVMPFQVKSLYEADEKIEDVPDSATDLPNDNDKIPKKRRRDSVIAVDSLISWLRDQVACYNLEINDIRDAFVRGDVLCAIVHRFRPDLIEYPLPSEENVDPLIAAAFMNQLAFDIMHQEYGLPHAMSGYESVQFASSDFLTLVAYLSQIYEIFRGEIPQTKYLRSESGDEVEENYHQPNLTKALKELRMKVTAKHHFSQKPAGRKSRLSSSKDSRDGDSEPHRRQRKRRSDEKHRAGSSSDICNSEPLSGPKLTKEGRKIQDRVFDAQRFMKSMQLLQMSQGHEPVSDDEENDGFHDFSFYLYRQTVPDFDERCKSLEEKLVGRGMKMSFGKSLRDSQDSEKMVPGLAKDLEAKLKGRTVEKQKPKDLIRAIGKIEKSDWNVQLIEKKMAEVKNSSGSKKDKDNKVPRWSREAYDDKREAMKRKMDGAGSGSENASIQKFEETVKTLGNKLKEGNTLDVGQRGSNKVSAMAEQLRHKFVKTVPEPEPEQNKQPARPTFEMPKKGRIDLCHFCKERVYVVERMTAEGKYFHRNCFRCEYCNTSLRIGNYVFDREGRYGERFYCAAHYTTVRMYGWKKFDTTRPEEKSENLLVPPASQQILTEMDERGTTPERVEFENSVDFASEEEILNEMDEDEWTDRNNFGASNAADNTSDEASDLSDDEEVTPDGNKIEGNVDVPCKVVNADPEGASKAKKDTESSDSDTEVASDDDDEDGSGECSDEDDLQDDDEEEEDEDDEYEEEECGGSTTEIETDSEFAEDPPHSVPGSIPTIIVNAPEQLVTRLVDSTPINHTQNSQPSKDSRVAEKQRHHHNEYNQRKVADLYYDDKSVELVKKGGPERQLPVVTPVPKKWEPLVFNNPDRLASIELKKKYLHGTVAPIVGNNQKKTTDAAATTQFKSLLDMISEQQKLLQPASQPSASMQAFLEGTEKLKNKTNLPYLNRNLSSFQTNNVNSSIVTQEKPATVLIENSIPAVLTDESHPTNNNDVSVKSSESHVLNSLEEMNSYEKDSLEPDIVVPDAKEVNELNSSNKEKDGEKAEIEFSVTITSTTDEEAEREEINAMMIASNDSFSASQSETETRSTVINVLGPNVNESSDNVSDDSDTEVGSGEPFSDLDDLDFEHNPPQILQVQSPPRVEIEDEFGVTQSLDATSENKPIKTESNSSDNEQESKYIMDLGLSESIGKSSSESSLNSGIFLETEISDYVKDEHSTAGQNKLKMKAKKSKQGQTYKKSRSKKAVVTEASDKVKGKPSLGFDLEALDFADIDGLSSPDDGGFDPVQNIQNVTKASELNVQLSPSNTPVDSIEGSCRTSTTTESPCEEDDEISSCSTKERRGNSASEADISENINFSSEENVDKITKIPPEVNKVQKQSFPNLERVGPFSSARDSLDYRKTKAITSHLKNKELYSTYAVPSVKVGTGARSPVWEEETNRLEDIGESTTSLDSSTINTMSDDSSKLIGSPGTTRKLNEIHQERVKQNDLIRSMVLGRIKRSPDKGIRRNSKGSLSGASLQSQTTQDKSGDESDSRKSSDNSQGPEGTTTSEDGSVEPTPLEANKGRSSSEDSSGNDNIPHRPMAESVSSSSDNSTTSRSARILLSPQKVQPTYEPVFTSSPRFRNRPKFEHLSKNYQSHTEPPTPSVETKQLPMYLNSEVLINQEKSKGIYSVANPLFFRSMPNLPQPMESFKGTVKDYLVSSDISSEADQVNVNYDSYSQNDSVLRSQKDTPVSQNYNPFLVNPPEPTSSNSVCPQDSYSISKDPIGDDFIDLHLKFRTGDRPSQRKLSPEKSRSVCTGSLSNYGDSGFYHGSLSTTASSPPKGSMQYNAGDNWILEKHETLSRPRSNTLTELNFKESQAVPRTQRASVSFVDDRNNPYTGSSMRQQNEYSDKSPKPHKSKALSSDTLLDGSPLSDNACRGTSVPDISCEANREPAKERKGKDRDRRRSLIQAVSDFFTRPNNSFDKSPSSGGQSLTTSASSSSIVSPSKEKFSLFKLTPKLLQTKDKKTSKSRECVVSPAANQGSSSSKYRSDFLNDTKSKPKTDYSAYFVQPLIQQLSSSPNPPKPERTFSSLIEKRASVPDFNSCTQNMATLSIVANSSLDKDNSDRYKTDYQSLDCLRSKEIEEIQLQLGSIEEDQTVLESRRVAIERKLRGEETAEDASQDNKLKEELKAINREKTRLARFEKELMVRAQELELEARKSQLEDQLYKSLSIRESEKSLQEKQHEIDILQELGRVNEQHSNLLNSIHADMEKYKSEDSSTSDFGLNPSGSSRLESDV